MGNGNGSSFRPTLGWLLGVLAALVVTAAATGVVKGYSAIGRIEAAVTTDQPTQLRLLRQICRHTAPTEYAREACDR